MEVNSVLLFILCLVVVGKREDKGKKKENKVFFLVSLDVLRKWTEKKKRIIYSFFVWFVKGRVGKNVCLYFYALIYDWKYYIQKICELQEKIRVY